MHTGEGGAAGATGPPEGEITVPGGRGNGDPKPGEQTTVTHTCVISCRAPHLRLRWGAQAQPVPAAIRPVPGADAREQGERARGVFTPAVRTEVVLYVGTT